MFRARNIWEGSEGEVALTFELRIKPKMENRTLAQTAAKVGKDEPLLTDAAPGTSDRFVHPLTQPSQLGDEPLPRNEP
jgi:hypothetical protein